MINIFKLHQYFMALFICSFGGDSSSSSSNSTTTTNVDKRQVVDAGGIGVSSDQSTVSVTNNSLDAGIVNTALDVVKSNDATNGASFSQLLSMADKLFTTSSNIIGKAQDTTLSQVGALTTLSNDQKGAVDQKTLIILGAVVAGAFAFGKK
jgi:hypothetical protein